MTQRRARRRVIVPLHDVAPPYEAAIRAQLDLLAATGVRRVALKVAPNWHGARPLSSSPTLVELLHAQVAAGSQLMSRGRGSKRREWYFTAVFVAVLSIMALAIVGVSATVNDAAGFGAWLGSFVAAQVLPQSNPLRDFLLFGWSYPPLPDHIGWMARKAALLLGALLLFVPQAALLRGEARLIRNSTE